jgi:hypothetical protein
MDSIQSLEELRRYVQTTLCDRHALDPKQFPMDESLLTRSGRPCGLYFCQYGPRLMKAHAVWDGEHAVVAFYDSSGARFQKVQLAKSPDPGRLAA